MTLAQENAVGKSMVILNLGCGSKTSSSPDVDNLMSLIQKKPIIMNPILPYVLNNLYEGMHSVRTERNL